MIIDLIDISILKNFYKLKANEVVTTWTIMNRIFKDCKKDSEKRAKHNLIKGRIRKMQGDLFEIKKENGRLTYILIEDNVRFCKHRFPSGNKDCLMARMDEKWNIFEL